MSRLRNLFMRKNVDVRPSAKERVLAAYPDAYLDADEYQNYITIPSRRQEPRTSDNWFSDMVGVNEPPGQLFRYGEDGAWERAAYELGL